jgi:hypothetical protein
MNFRREIERIIDNCTYIKKYDIVYVKDTIIVLLEYKNEDEENCKLLNKLLDKEFISVEYKLKHLSNVFNQKIDIKRYGEI